jgi:hypothetical protein
MTHAYIYAPSIDEIRNFHPVTFWEQSILQKDKEFLKAKSFISDNTDVRNWSLRYGLWPWQLAFGVKPGPTSSYYYNAINNNLFVEGIDTKVYTEEWHEYVHQRWKFRKIFWIRWLQILVLGTPALLFYSIGGRSTLKAGVILYGFITCGFLLWFKEFNQKSYVLHLQDQVEANWNKDHPGSPSDAGGIADSDLVKTSLRHNLDTVFNSYDSTFTMWIATCVYLIAFQAIPYLTTFYRIIISSGILIVVSLAFAKLYPLGRWVETKIRDRYVVSSNK